MINNSVKKFSPINTIEGWSYLVLLFIAMPMKYMLGIPLAVKIAAMVHGVLFIIFFVLLVVACQDTKWAFKENFFTLLSIIILFFP